MARALRASDDYVQYPNDINSSHALRVDRNWFDVGGIIRIGPPGSTQPVRRLDLWDRRAPRGSADSRHEGRIRAGHEHELLGRYIDHRIARVNALWGIRDIGFIRVQGFDALSATQDLPIGFQLGTLFGRSLSVLGSRDDDIFMAGDLFIGMAGRNNALRFQLGAEGRRNNREDNGTG